MVRLVLHIGMGKTGTSTLQAELTARHRQLARQGVCYPVVGRSRNQSALNCLIRPVDRVPRQFRTPDRREQDAMRAFGESFWADLRRIVERSGADVTVISSEHFFYLDADELSRLGDLLADQFSEIRVVAYVRSPADYYVAVTQQRVRASHEIVPPASYRIPIRRCLERHRHEFGDDVVVRTYERAALVGEDIVDDFASVAMPGVSLRRSKRADVNVSMTAEAMCIMQRFRRARFPDDNDVFNPETHRLLDALERVQERIPQTAPRLTGGLARLVTENHREDLDWLADELGVSFDLPDTPVGTEPSHRGSSDDLSDVLDVTDERIDATLYALLAELTHRSAMHTFASKIRRRAETEVRWWLPDSLV